MLLSAMVLLVVLDLEETDANIGSDDEGPVVNDG